MVKVDIANTGDVPVRINGQVLPPAHGGEFMVGHGLKIEEVGFGEDVTAAPPAGGPAAEAAEG